MSGAIKVETALIGYTGFVGSHLRRQGSFTALYNSKNFMEMQGKQYNVVVCAGVSSVKWMANREPQKDWDRIEKLKRVLDTIEAHNFILISTIDVYQLSMGADEDYIGVGENNHAYGKNRLEFEIFCEKKFPNHTIVRLPGLFGEGLKKNVIYDLLNDNCLEMINPRSSFQYYDLECLWKDIEKAVENNIKKINLFTGPIATEEILKTFFSSKVVGGKASAEVHYDLHTKYASHWGKSGPYIYTKDEIMKQLSKFIDRYKEHNGKK